VGSIERESKSFSKNLSMAQFDKVVVGSNPTTQIKCELTSSPVTIDVSID